MALDEIIEKHKKTPLKWPKGIGGDFEFYDDLPIIYTFNHQIYKAAHHGPIQHILLQKKK